MTSWVQLNVGLGRAASADSARASAGRLFEALTGPLTHWREDGDVIWFFFQRKPPDVRLRFCTSAAEPLHRDLAAMIEPLRAAGVATTTWFSVYEPEYRKFGGRWAMAAVHEWFDADTTIWLDLALDGADAGPAIHPSRVCPAAADDLFGRVLGDADEVWDTWCNFRDLLPRFDAPSPPRPETLATLAAGMPARHAAVVSRFGPANQRLADALAAAGQAGELTVGLRAVLPFVAQHSFQRWGLDGPAQAAITDVMTDAWDPHRRLRGA